MSRSELTPPTPPTSIPSPAVAAGSSPPDSTSSARASQKATKRRWSTVEGMTHVVTVVILPWAAALTIPMPNGFLYGGASRAPVVTLMYITLIVAKRHGYETFVVHELEKRRNERDRAASQRAWTLAGVIGLIGNAVIGTVGAFEGPTTPVSVIVL